MRIRRALSLIAALSLAVPAAAQEGEDPDETVIDAWARALAESTLPRWVGPRVPWSAPSDRPPSVVPEQPRQRKVTETSSSPR